MKTEPLEGLNAEQARGVQEIVSRLSGLADEYKDKLVRALHLLEETYNQTCKNCTHWTQVEEIGICRKLLLRGYIITDDHGPRESASIDNGNMYTRSGFCCNRYEGKKNDQD